MGGLPMPIFFMVLHLIPIFCNQTYYVPDEFWQSLEVAHHLIFDYGYLTWEWTQGIRSYVYPGIFAMLYKALQYFQLDTVITLTVLPRVIQAIISAFGDYKFWKWVCQQTGSRGQWAAFSLATSWFWIYCGSRTLSNTLETSLTMMALQAYPWGSKDKREGSVSYLWFVGLACLLRPTASIIWVPLCFYNILTTSRRSMFLFKSVLILASLTAAITAIDSYMYQRIIFTPWNFLKMNVFEGVGSFYGKHPHHWYLSQGLPVLLGVHLLPFLLGTWKTIQARWRDVETPLLCVIIWTVFIYSGVEHKEHRFLLPLLPMALFISSSWLSRWSRSAHGALLWITAILMLLGAAVPSYYFGMVHQQGTMKVMPILADAAVKAPNTTNILFLMPCHSTPLYSHVHVNVPMRILSCEPNLSKVENYVDEAEQFFDNPEKWLEAEFPAEAAVPSHIVAFDNVHEAIRAFLKGKGYVLKSKLEHVHKHLKLGKVGEYVHVYVKK